MRRTTIYLPAEMKTAIERVAVLRGVTEAEVIREAITGHLGTKGERSFHLPLFPEGLGANLAGHVGQLLEDPDRDR